MDDSEHGEHVEDLSEHTNQVGNYLLVVLEGTVEALVGHTVDAFTFIELTLDVEEEICEALSTNLVGQPYVFSLLQDCVESSDFEDAWEFDRVNGVASVGGVGLRKEKFTHCDFDLGRRVEHTTRRGGIFGLRELLEGHLATCVHLSGQPDHGTATFAKQTQFFIAFWTSVTIGHLFKICEAPLFVFGRSRASMLD